MLDKERHLLFSLNAIDALEDEIGDIGDIEKHMKGKGRMKFITWLIALLLNEAETYKHFQKTGKIEGAEMVTEQIVGLLINSSNINEVLICIRTAMAVANRGDEELPEDEEDGDIDDEEIEGEEGKTMASEEN